jgi:hypothetical protein
MKLQDLQGEGASWRWVGENPGGVSGRGQSAGKAAQLFACLLAHPESGVFAGQGGTIPVVSLAILSRVLDCRRGIADSQNHLGNHIAGGLAREPRRGQSQWRGKEETGWPATSHGLRDLGIATSAPLCSILIPVVCILICIAAPLTWDGAGKTGGWQRGCLGSSWRPSRPSRPSSCS